MHAGSNHTCIRAASRDFMSIPPPTTHLSRNVKNLPPTAPVEASFPAPTPLACAPSQGLRAENQYLRQDGAGRRPPPPGGPRGAAGPGEGRSNKKTHPRALPASQPRLKSRRSFSSRSTGLEGIIVWFVSYMLLCTTAGGGWRENFPRIQSGNGLGPASL